MAIRINLAPAGTRRARFAPTVYLWDRMIATARVGTVDRGRYLSNGFARRDAQDAPIRLANPLDQLVAILALPRLANRHACPSTRRPRRI